MMLKAILPPLPLTYRRPFSALLMAVGLTTGVLMAGSAMAEDPEGSMNAVSTAAYVQVPADQVSGSGAASPRQPQVLAREVRIEQVIEAGLGMDGLETLVAGLQVPSSTDVTSAVMTEQQRTIERSVYAAIGGVFALMLTVLAGVNSRKRWPAMTSRRIRIRIAEQR